MNDNGHPTIIPPSAAMIERRFNGPVVKGLRPLVTGGVEMVKIFRRMRWVPHGLENLEHLEPPLIFAANHMSHVDTAAILGTLPRRLRSHTAVAAAMDVFGSNEKKAVAKVPNLCLQYLVASGFHAFAFDRHGSPLRSIRTAVTLVRDGWNLLLFPEGTRSRDGELRPFKLGVGVLAKFTDRPVVPIHVSGGNNVLPCDVFLPRAGDIHVRYGRPMYYLPDDNPQKFVERVRQSVAALGGSTVHLNGHNGLHANGHTNGNGNENGHGGRRATVEFISTAPVREPY